MENLTFEQYFRAIERIRRLDYSHRFFPGSCPPGWPVGGNTISWGYITHYRDLSSRALWDAYIWNPPQYVNAEGSPYLLTFDTNAGPKLTWEEIVASWVAYNQEQLEKEYTRAQRNITSTGNDLANVGIQHEAETIYVGEGIDRMSGLDYIHSHSGEAGKNFSQVVLRNEERTGVVNILIRDDLAKILSRVTYQRNLAEGAKNIIASKIQKAYNIWQTALATFQDESLPQTERDVAETEATTAEQILRDQINLTKTDIETEYVRLEADTSLPSDVDTARAVLISRLSAHTNRARNRVIAATENAEAYLSTSCIEQQQAIEQISAKRQAGIINMNRATSIVDIQKEQNAAILLIDSISVLNTPLWVDGDGNDLTLDSDDFLVITHVWDAAAKTHDIVTLQTKNSEPISPRTSKELGNVAITEMVQNHQENPWNQLVWGHFRTMSGVDTTAQKTSISYIAAAKGAPPAASEITLVSRNACGPAILKIKINVINT